MFENEKDVWSVQLLAKNLGIGKNAAYALVNSKRIHSIRIGQNIRIPKVSVLDFLLENEYNNNRNGGLFSVSQKGVTAWQNP